MRAPILCLLLALACSRYASAAETSDTIAAMKNNCLTTGIPTGAATTQQCQDCVDTIGNLNGLTSQRMYACYDVCQSSSVAPTDPAKCISCIENPAYDVTACKQCLSVPNGGSGVCFDNLANDPYKADNLDASQIYKRLNYFYAVAQCASLPDTPGVKARTQCFTCISTKLATPQGAPTYGILSYAELNPPAGTPAPTPRDNDFGACVFLANQTELIAQGSQAVQGVYANCIPKGYHIGDTLSLSLSDCMNCMATVDAVLVPGTSAPRFPPMSYACADYCQNPDYLTSASTATAKASLAQACVTCLKKPTVTSAWACGNCMQTANPDVCFQCVYDEPYSGNTSNYNWACGMCANIKDADLQNLCLECIKSQTGSGAENTDATTESNICSCIDLVQNNSISVNRTLTAMERTCFEPFTKRDSNGKLLPSPAIPWGADTRTGNSSECLNCMAIANQGASLPGLNKAYACHEYCQNPDLVANEKQGNDCAQCVISDRVTDPWACEVCMLASNDTNTRGDCFACLKAASIWPSHSWGCGQCAQFSNTEAYTACFQCLAKDLIDPCACVDGVKNGTITAETPITSSGVPTGPGVINTVCEHSFAVLTCVNASGAPISGPQIITGVSQVFYGRVQGDTTTCSAGCIPYGSSPTCLGAGLTSTCAAPASDITTITNGALHQCVGRHTCALTNSDFYSGFGNYALNAENGNFPSQDPCVGVYKYMKYEYTCGVDVGK